MPKTMKLTDVGCTDKTVQRYIEDHDWIMQQKFDGTRIMVTWDSESETMLWSNDGLKPVTHSAAKLKIPALEELLRPVFETMELEGDGKLSLDGELLIRTGEFVIWDILSEERVEKGVPWHARHSDLEAFFWLMNDVLNVLLGGQDLIRLTPTAETEEDKRILWERVKESNVEGAVSKLIDSAYLPGIRTKEWVKHKLVKTADLVVTDVRRVFKPNSQVVKEGSAQLAVVEDGAISNLCSSSLIGKDLSIAAGDVVEVAYLYREPGGGLVQPRIIKKRWDAMSGTGDKHPNGCGWDQFPEYSREVVDLNTNTKEKAV